MRLRCFPPMIPVDKIREVIGSGGKVIQKICAECDVKMDIEEDGHVFISGIDHDNLQPRYDHHRHHCQRSGAGRHL